MNRNKRGAFSSVILLFSCLGLLIVGSIGIDVAHAFYARRQLQSAADNAALTGAYYLCSISPTPPSVARAEQYARQMAARCIVDGRYADHDGETTIVEFTPELKPFRGPHVCNVSITRNVPTSLARLVGVNYMPVAADASAGAYMYGRTVMPNFMTNLAISHRAGSGKLNFDLKDKENNGWFINEWKGQDSPNIKFGTTPVTAGQGNLNNLAKQVVHNVAIVRGGDPESAQPTSSEIIGSTSIIIDDVKSPTSATIRFVPGTLIKGHPGTQFSGKLTSKDIEFAQRNGHWRIALMK